MAVSLLKQYNIKTAGFASCRRLMVIAAIMKKSLQCERESDKIRMLVFYILIFKGGAEYGKM